AAQCLGANRQCHRLESGLPGRRRGRRRIRVHLSRHRQAHGRCRVVPEHARRERLRVDFRRHLYPAQSDRRHYRHRHQSSHAASAMTTDTQDSAPAAVALAEHQPVIVRRSLVRRAWRELRRAPLSAWFGLIVILLYILTAIFAPLIAPYSETDVVGGAYEPWSEQFFFGTDQLGR